MDKDESTRSSAPFRIGINGAEGYCDPGSGGGFPERPDSHATFLGRSGGSPEGITKTAGRMVPACGMILDRRIEGWHKQQRQRLSGSPAIVVSSWNDADIVIAEPFG